MTTDITKNWITETWTEWGLDRVNPLADYTLLKVYNPMMWQDPDPSLDWQIVKLWEDWWEEFGKTLKDVKVLTLTKCYKWYATKLEGGKPVTDDSWKAITELYYTPEVSVYDKSNIAIAKSTENGPQVLGKGWFQNYIDFTTAMTLEDWTINPLFNTIGTNSQTWEKYPISIMKQEYSMYFEMDGKLYKIRLWASYWRWKDVQKGTFLYAKDQWMKAFKEAYSTMRFEFHYLTLNAKVEKADKYKFLNWEFDSVTSESVIDQLTKTNWAVDDLNVQNFPWLTVWNWMEALPFDMNRLALTTREKVADIIDSIDWEEIDKDNLPF